MGCDAQALVFEKLAREEKSEGRGGGCPAGRAERERAACRYSARTANDHHYERLLGLAWAAAERRGVTSLHDFWRLRR
jgi:hypothetical protein